MTTQTQEQTRTEQFKIDPDRLLAEFRRLIKEGNVRRSASSKATTRSWNYR